MKTWLHDSMASWSHEAMLNHIVADNFPIAELGSVSDGRFSARYFSGISRRTAQAKTQILGTKKPAEPVSLSQTTSVGIESRCQIPRL